MNTPPLQFSMTTNRCAWCHQYPCHCPRVEPCICGGWLVADGRHEQPTDHTALVARHNRSPEHQAWRAKVADGGPWRGPTTTAWVGRFTGGRP